MFVVEIGGDRKVAKWKKLSSEDLGITTSMISNPTRMVLNGLKKRGVHAFGFIEICISSLSTRCRY